MRDSQLAPKACPLCHQMGRLIWIYTLWLVLTLGGCPTGKGQVLALLLPLLFHCPDLQVIDAAWGQEMESWEPLRKTGPLELGDDLISAPPHSQPIPHQAVQGPRRHWKVQRDSHSTSSYPPRSEWMSQACWQKDPRAQKYQERAYHWMRH